MSSSRSRTLQHAPSGTGDELELRRVARLEAASPDDYDHAARVGAVLRAQAASRERARRARIPEGILEEPRARARPSDVGAGLWLLAGVIIGAALWSGLIAGGFALYFAARRLLG
jgi:hypothetical protein